MVKNGKNSNVPSDQLNMASYFLDYNVTQGRGKRAAVYYKDKTYSYNDIYKLTNQV